MDFMEALSRSRDEEPWWSWRMVPPAHSNFSGAALLCGIGALLDSRWMEPELEAEDRLAWRFEADAVCLTGSGTAALTLALRAAIRRTGCSRVALPAYTSYSVATAAAGAGAQATLYDLDPETLSPDLASLERALSGGARTVVVAHLYGQPADAPEVRKLADAFEALVIEDAAQAAGGVLRGAPLGSMAPLSVLSFGHGKGLSCGGGGALLVRDPNVIAGVLREARRFPLLVRSGLREAVVAVAQWICGHPRSYRLAAMLPPLGSGETRYHPPREPGPITRFGARALGELLRSGPAVREIEARRTNTGRLAQRLGGVEGVNLIHPVPGAEPGALRFPFILAGRSRTGAPALGVLPGYPRMLSEIREFTPFLAGAPSATPGAARLAGSLYTAATHSWVTEGDLDAVEAWVRGRAAESRARVVQLEPLAARQIA